MIAQVKFINRVHANTNRMEYQDVSCEVEHRDIQHLAHRIYATCVKHYCFFNGVSSGFMPYAHVILPDGVSFRMDVYQDRTVKTVNYADNSVIETFHV